MVTAILFAANSAKAVVMLTLNGSTYLCDINIEGNTIYIENCTGIIGEVEVTGDGNSSGGGGSHTEGLTGIPASISSPTGGGGGSSSSSSSSGTSSNSLSKKSPEQPEDQCDCNGFINSSNPFNGAYYDYVFMEGWGLSYGGCYYSGFTSSQSSGSFSFSAGMKILSQNHEAVFWGIIKYFADGVLSGSGNLNSQTAHNSTVIYDSSYSNLGVYNGNITKRPCNTGKLDTSLGFTVYQFFNGTTQNTVYRNSIVITSTK